jgi:hypothetical protein
MHPGTEGLIRIASSRHALRYLQLFNAAPGFTLSTSCPLNTSLTSLITFSRNLSLCVREKKVAARVKADVSLPATMRY